MEGIITSIEYHIWWSRQISCHWWIYCIFWICIYIVQPNVIWYVTTVGCCRDIERHNKWPSSYELLMRYCDNYLLIIPKRQRLDCGDDTYQTFDSLQVSRLFWEMKWAVTPFKSSLSVSEFNSGHYSSDSYSIDMTRLVTMPLFDFPSEDI